MPPDEAQQLQSTPIGIDDENLPDAERGVEGKLLGRLVAWIQRPGFAARITAPSGQR
jgi:hypothetical protein